MKYKYDDIIDIEVELSFIKSYFYESKNMDFYDLEKQISYLYELEYNSNKDSITNDSGKHWYEEEYHLNHIIKSRNDMLIHKAGIEYLCENNQSIKQELGQNYGEILKQYDEIIKEKNIQILKNCLWIFNAKGNNIIYGKERDINSYKVFLYELTKEQEQASQEKQKRLN